METLKQLVNRICKSHKVSKKDDEHIKDMALKITNLKPEQIKILANLKSGYIKKDDIEQLTNLFDDVNKQIDVSDSVETELISSKITSCDIENELDKKVSKYNGFSEKHPMDYVNYDESHSNYRVRQTEQSFASKKSEVVCKKMLEIFYANLKKSFQEIGVDKKIPIKYAEKYMLVYNTVDEPLFDIQHVLSMLGLEQSSVNEKYDTFKQNITHFGVHKNQFGGYIIREFVTFKIMCQIIMSSNKKFAKKFKEDVSEILDNLRQNNQLILSRNTLLVNNTEHSQLIENRINSVIESGKELQSYDNPVYNEFVKNLIISGTKISITPYMNNHVMYMFITTLKDPTEKNRILCKVGYTYDIVTRIASLRSEYGCKFYQIAFKIVKSKQYEEDFHKMIKTLHNNLHVPMKHKNKEKDEIYVFDKILYNEFMNIKNVKHIQHDLQTDHANIQYATHEHPKEISHECKIKKINDSTEKKLYQKLLTEHEKCIKQIKILEKRIEILEMPRIVNNQEIHESCTDVSNELLFFKEHFDFTDKKAVMGSTELLEELRFKFPKMSNQKIKSYLTKNMGLKFSKCIKRLDGIRGYYGIKLKEQKSDL